MADDRGEELSESARLMSGEDLELLMAETPVKVPKLAMGDGE